MPKSAVYEAYRKAIGAYNLVEATSFVNTVQQMKDGMTPNGKGGTWIIMVKEKSTEGVSDKLVECPSMLGVIRETFNQLLEDTRTLQLCGAGDGKGLPTFMIKGLPSAIIEDRETVLTSGFKIGGEKGDMATEPAEIQKGKDVVAMLKAFYAQVVPDPEAELVPAPKAWVLAPKPEPLESEFVGINLDDEAPIQPFVTPVVVDQPAVGISENVEPLVDD